MQISVQPSDWGDARTSDIEKLLVDVASHIERSLRDSLTGVVVVPAPEIDPNPRTLCRHSPSDPFKVQLTARHKLWGKFAYQFAHELCHVLSNLERLRGIQTTGLSRHSASCLLFSHSDRWRKDGVLNHRTPIGQVMRGVWPVIRYACRLPADKTIFCRMPSNYSCHPRRTILGRPVFGKNSGISMKLTEARSRCSHMPCYQYSRASPWDGTLYVAYLKPKEV